MVVVVVAAGELGEMAVGVWAAVAALAVGV